MYRKPFVLLALLPLHGLASTFDYTYVEGGYVNTEVDTSGGDIDGDGLGLRGSLALNDQIHLIAAYTTLDLDFGIDLEQMEVGVGYAYTVNPKLDLVGTVSYVNAEIDTAFGDDDEDGIGLGIGLRGLVAEQIELEGGIDYVDVGDSDTSLRIDGRYYFSDQLAAGLGLSHNEDGTTWRLGLRWEFGPVAAR